MKFSQTASSDLLQIHMDDSGLYIVARDDETFEIFNVVEFHIRATRTDDDYHVVYFELTDQYPFTSPNVYINYKGMKHYIHPFMEIIQQWSPAKSLIGICQELSSSVANMGDLLQLDETIIQPTTVVTHAKNALPLDETPTRTAAQWDSAIARWNGPRRPMSMYPAPYVQKSSYNDKTKFNEQSVSDKRNIRNVHYFTRIC